MYFWNYFSSRSDFLFIMQFLSCCLMFILYLIQQLVEPAVTIRVRQADKALVESLLGKAQQDYKAKIKKDVQLKIDTENYLPPDTCGGIELIAAKGRIKVLT